MKRTLSIVLAVAALALLFSACNKKSTTSVDQCISNFMSDINSSDRSTVYENLDSSSQMYNAAKAASYWTAIFPTGQTYSLSNKSESSSSVTATLTSSGATYPGNAITFSMSTDSDDNAVISAITINGYSGTVYD